MEKIARRSPAGSFNSDEGLNLYLKRESVHDYGYGRAGSPYRSTGSPYRSPVRSARSAGPGSSSPLIETALRTEMRFRGEVMKSQAREDISGGSYLASRSSELIRTRSRRREGGSRLTVDPYHENDIKMMRNDHGSHYEDLYGREALEMYGDDYPEIGSHRDSRYVEGGIRSGYMRESARSRGRRYTNEGLSYYHPNTMYDQPRHSHVSADSINSHLLRKCAELEEQIYRIGNSGHSSRRGQGTAAYPQDYGRADDDLYAVENHYPRERTYRDSLILDDDDDIGIEHQIPSGGHSRVRYGSGCNMEYVDSYDPRSPALDGDDDDPSLIQMQRWSHYRPHYYHQQQPVDDYVPRSVVESNHDLDDKFAHHHPNCVCSHCRAGSFRTHDHPKAMTGDFAHISRSSSARTEPNAKGSDLSYNPQPVNPPPNKRSSSHSVSDHNGSSHASPRRPMVTKKKSGSCHPIAGGAPFVVCSHCSELLKLPKKAKAVKQSRMKCGSCSTVLIFDLESKSPIPFLPPEFKPRSTAVENIRSDKALLDEPVKEIAQESSIAKTFSAEACTSDKADYTFRSTDSELSTPLEEQKISFIEADRNPGFLSPHSSHASKEECDSDSVSDNPLVNAHSMRDSVSSPHASPLPEHLGYYEVLGEARRAMDVRNRGEETSADGEGGAMPLNSAESRAQATEIDINTDEMPKTEQSQGSTGTPSTKDGQRNKKSSGWFLPSLIGKGTGSSSVSSSVSTPRTDVFVNGQPILHRAVARAEKLAGPISPGEYWYDSRAGFWGLVGSYCLGIIPPYIQEFGFPMQAECSGGSTSVYVNGRELHQIDLNVLARRGLPRIENKYYALDISGRVVLEDTGEYVADLKRLAPSVEKNKRGFGMKPPDRQANR